MHALSIQLVVHFCLQVSPYAQLDLFHYTCRDLLVSFAVSNVARLSNSRASLAHVQVHGGKQGKSRKDLDNYYVLWISIASYSIAMIVSMWNLLTGH